MAVRQEELRSPVAERTAVASLPTYPSFPPRKASAVFKRSDLVRNRGTVERWFAWVVLVFSLGGTIVVMHGGWEPVIGGRWSIPAILSGIAAQAVLTWMQWSYGQRRTSLLYLAPLIIDGALTVWGYGPAVVPQFSIWLAAHSVPQAIAFAWAAMVLVSFAMAWYPETRLID